ncbi:Na+/H+ antiporter NhaA [Bradyrhizobium sp. JYMT SZCCT0428]|uniref:Na+/H+ antiporter NhaA n=1 Tax=Bradyrhizobium sp. JYMT SZCCT0428 TaxID=2807673 RepID=UPI001BA55734|nr:Na+/H+ antiporter NhaA [Bradyrhizobium sp. JYMT SZCCT0428]MBR1156675.1 Na+/H+ antiporter NhaA [Bradyrhizobium sp. JYMT SZCCT0428]
MHTRPQHRPRSVLRRLITSEASGGLVLMLVAAVALIVANSPAAPLYFGALKTNVFGLSVLHWINDGLMAAFFLLVGLEIKREMLDGELSTWPKRALPGMAALGGMAVPALIYVAFNANTPHTLRGWAIPSATDIAFALGVLSLLGRRVPVSLKVFLTALAILDDLGAVLIIAAFYTADLNLVMVALACAVILLLTGLNWAGVDRLGLYFALGAVLWFLVLKSGVHATLAGVALAVLIPLRKQSTGDSALIRLEHTLQPWVAFIIVPIFGFANAGLAYSGTSLSTLLEPVPLGVVLGLFVGKQIGVSLFSWIAIRIGVAALPANASWTQFYGVAVLCGIGFTMSLFIGLLAFPTSQELQDAVKIGVLAGSMVSAAVGAALLTIRPVGVRG